MTPWLKELVGKDGKEREVGETLEITKFIKTLKINLVPRVVISG